MTSLSENTVVTTSGGLVELGYSQITSSVTVGTSVTNVTSTLTVVCDGGPILVEFFAPSARCFAGGDNLTFSLFEDGVQKASPWGESVSSNDLQATPVQLQYRLTPSAGSHTYQVKAISSLSSSQQVRAGSGGTGSPAYSPAFLRISKIVQASQFIVPLASAPLVTSLPSAPIDGQEIRYLADANNGVIWNLRYRAASASSYKWEFVGGSSLRSTGAGSSTNSTTPQTTNTPSITVPLAGDYDCSYGGFTQNTAYGVVYNSTIYLYKDNTSLENVIFVPVGTYNGASIAGVYRATSLTASQVLNLRYAVSTTSSTSSFGALFINATPIRVG